MTGRTHRYEVRLVWTGDRGAGTSSYRAYGREHEVTAQGPPPIPGSADPAFRGDAERWNPEQLLVAALSQCHLLSYLHLCAVDGVVVVAYEDRPDGVMAQREDGGGTFTEVTLRPQVTVAEPSMIDRATELHGRAHELCFIAASVSFPVRHEPRVTFRPASR